MGDGLNFLVGETDDFCLELMVGLRKLLCFLNTDTTDCTNETSCSGSYFMQGGVYCLTTDSLLFGTIDLA